MEQTQTDPVNREGCSRILSGLALSFRLPRTLSIWWFFAVIVGLAYLIAPGNVGAQITILYSFGGGKPAAGVHPNGGLVLGRDGELYGTTEEELDTRTWGFPSGTVFRFDPATSRFNDLKSFSPLSIERRNRRCCCFTEESLGSSPKPIFGADQFFTSALPGVPKLGMHLDCKRPTATTL